MRVTEILRDRHAHALILFGVGRTKLRALALHNPPVRIIKLDKSERKWLTSLTYNGKPYPLARALRAFRAAGQKLGITKSARVILRALANGAPDHDQPGENMETEKKTLSEADQKAKREAANARKREWRAAKKAALASALGRGNNNKGTKVAKKKKTASKAKRRTVSGMFADDAKITLLVKDNPKRPDTKAHGAFSKYVTGMTVAEFLEAGGSRADLSWDVRHKFISVT